MSPRDQSTQTSDTSPRSERQPHRTIVSRQLITFVDSQDPSSRSAIQRHTARHSNAQRRDARLQSLQSNRPRLLEWHRRPSADTDALTVTSPQSSTSSASISPAPALPKSASAPGDLSTELTQRSRTVAEPIKAPIRNSSVGQAPELLDASVDDTEIENCELLSNRRSLPLTEIPELAY